MNTCVILLITLNMHGITQQYINNVKHSKQLQLKYFTSKHKIQTSSGLSAMKRYYEQMDYLSAITINSSLLYDLSDKHKRYQSQFKSDSSSHNKTMQCDEAVGSNDCRFEIPARKRVMSLPKRDFSKECVLFSDIKMKQLKAKKMPKVSYIYTSSFLKSNQIQRHKSFQSIPQRIHFKLLKLCLKSHIVQTIANKRIYLCK